MTYSTSGNSSSSSRKTCSLGIVFTLPERISSTRRLISSAQASSTPSSAGPSSKLSTRRSNQQTSLLRSKAESLLQQLRKLRRHLGHDHLAKIDFTPLQPNPFLFLSTTYPQPIPNPTAKPRFSPIH